MSTNLRAYFRSGNLVVGDSNNLHIHSGWSNTKDNFGGILKELSRERQRDMMVMGGTKGPPAANAATVMAYSSDSRSYPDF